MTLNDEDMDTFVFAVGTKKAMARLQKEMQDLVNILHNLCTSNFSYFYYTALLLLHTCIGLFVVYL